MLNQHRIRILLKITGQLLSNDKSVAVSAYSSAIISQIKQLSSSFQFAIVIGGGNIFRGAQQGKLLGLDLWTAHTIGMLATMMNGLVFKDLLEKAGVEAVLLSAFHCPNIAADINKKSVSDALASGAVILFIAGTGNPFFTTDTNAVLRALEMNADYVWKGTGVDGIYSEDPKINPHAHLLKNISYDQAIADRLSVMDLTALTMARDNKLTIRIFNIFSPDALVHVANDKDFGSTIHP